MTLIAAPELYRSIDAISCCACVLVPLSVLFAWPSAGGRGKTSSKILNLWSSKMADIDRLISACESGHLEVIEKLLDGRIDVNSRSNSGDVALIAAARHGLTKAVELFLNRGADVNMQDKEGLSALMVATNPEIIKMLIHCKDADVNLKAADGSSALMKASVWSYNDTRIKLLIKKGAEVNMQNEQGWFALAVASENGNIDTVKVLIDNGADVNMQTSDGTSSLMIACTTQYCDIVELLIEKGADVNLQSTDGGSALIVASGKSTFLGEDMQRRYNIAELLIKSGAEINMQNNDGLSALINASQYGHYNIAELLIQKGAEIDMQYGNGTTALIVASRFGHCEVVRLLVEKGAKINMQNNEGQTALIIASENDYEYVVKLLLEKSAAVNIQDQRGLSALIAASRRSSYRQHMLTSYGIQFVINRLSHVNVIKLLLENDAEVNKQDCRGFTALTHACINGAKGAVEVLRKHGADANIRTNSGKIAKDLAYERGYCDIGDLLPNDSLSEGEIKCYVYYRYMQRWHNIVSISCAIGLVTQSLLTKHF